MPVNPKQLKELLHATPFVPFSLVLATGKVYHVGNPDVLNVTIQGQIIHEDVIGPTTYLNPILIYRDHPPNPIERRLTPQKSEPLGARSC